MTMFQDLVEKGYQMEFEEAFRIGWVEDEIPPMTDSEYKKFILELDLDDLAQRRGDDF